MFAHSKIINVSRLLLEIKCDVKWVNTCDMINTLTQKVFVIFTSFVLDFLCVGGVLLQSELPPAFSSDRH